MRQMLVFIFVFGYLNTNLINSNFIPDVHDQSNEIVFTAEAEIDITVQKKLICSPDSYFESLSYHETYKQNQTCFGSIYTKRTNLKSIYTRHPRGGGRPIVLNAKKEVKKLITTMV